MLKRSLHAALLAAAVVTAPGLASAQTKLLHFPDIHGDKAVFTYGGDLWIAPASGGTAIRLTAHPGVEVFGRFSPDGKWIAFTGQYDGDEQVYVIPATGGEPKQLTFYPARGPLTPRWGYDNQVYGWTNDGKAVIFRSLRDSWALPIARLYTVAATGGPAEPLPMPEAGSGAFSPDGSKIVYSPQSRDFRSEKRYAGGQANQLYIFDLKTLETKRISDSPHRQPRPDVDRQHDLLQLGSRRSLQSLRLRCRGRQNHAGNATRPLGCPVAERRPGRPYYLRARRRTPRIRHQDQEGRGDLHCRSRRRAGAQGEPHFSREFHGGFFTESEGRARPLLRSRRDLHCAGRKGPDPQPHALIGRARQVAPLVARWIANRVHLRQERRRRDLGGRPGRIDPS